MLRFLTFAGVGLALAAGLAAGLSVLAPPEPAPWTGAASEEGQPGREMAPGPGDPSPGVRVEPSADAISPGAAPNRDSAHVEAPTPPDEGLPKAEPRMARDVTPPGIHSGPIRTVPKEQRPPPTPEPKVRTYHRVVVGDAGAFAAGDTVVRLAGIRAPAIDETCTDEAGKDWPCGRAAAAALRRLVRSRAVECDVVRETADGIAGICRVGSREINAWLVAEGWAKAAESSQLTDAAANARSKRRGVFTNRWHQEEVAPPVEIPEPVAPLEFPTAPPAALPPTSPAPADDSGG